MAVNEKSVRYVKTQHCQKYYYLVDLGFKNIATKVSSLNQTEIVDPANIK